MRHCATLSLGDCAASSCAKRMRRMVWISVDGGDGISSDLDSRLMGFNEWHSLSGWKFRKISRTIYANSLGSITQTVYHEMTPIPKIDTTPFVNFVECHGCQDVLSGYSIGVVIVRA